MLQVIDGHEHGYGKSCDIWSVGVILYILLCGCPPFGQGISMPVLFERIRRGNYSFPAKYWSGVSEDAKDIVTKMMTVDPEKRLCAETTLAHRWVSRFQGGDLSHEQLSAGLDRLKEWNVIRKLKVGNLTSRRTKPAAAPARRGLSRRCVRFAGRGQHGAVAASLVLWPGRVYSADSGAAESDPREDPSRPPAVLPAPLLRLPRHGIGPAAFPEARRCLGLTLETHGCASRQHELRDAFDALDYSKSGTIDVSPGPRSAPCSAAPRCA